MRTIIMGVLFGGGIVLEGVRVFDMAYYDKSASLLHYVDTFCSSVYNEIKYYQYPVVIML